LDLAKDATDAFSNIPHFAVYEAGDIIIDILIKMQAFQQGMP
jgi:hypothetical protein